MFVVKWENLFVDFGVDLTVVFQFGVEYYFSVVISLFVGSNVFILLVDVVIGG